MKNNLVPPLPAGPAWHFQWIDISIADLMVMGLLIVIFILALFIPFPRGEK